ncbi:MAG: 30S ribosomal protein S5 [Mycoplasma sp.]|nr:30S ribosomal protein S5 [Mycoplasma sp.]
MAFFIEDENLNKIEEQSSSNVDAEVSSTAKDTQEISQNKSAKTQKEHFAKNNTEFNKNKKNTRPRPKAEKKAAEFEDKIIDIARVTTVVKGGRRFSFSAIVAIGNKKGKVGLGHGKANEVPDAIKKAFKNAENNLIEVPIINKSTIPHEVKAKYSASQVILKPAPKGKGIVASGTIRTVVELAGYTDIYTKSYGSRTKQNAAKVAIKALKQLRTVEKLASLRDVSVEHILKK